MPGRKEVDFDALYAKYENLIGYAANCYRSISSAVDVDDLYQEGCLLLMKTWTRDDLEEVVREPLFKKSLFLLLRSKAYKQVKLANQLVGLRSSDDESSGIDLDVLFSTTDVEVLNEIYVGEFVAELKRLLDAGTVELLDFILSPEFKERGEITRKGSWVPAVAQRLGRTINEVYYLSYKLQHAARAVMPKFGLKVA